MGAPPPDTPPISSTAPPPDMTQQPVFLAQPTNHAPVEPVEPAGCSDEPVVTKPAAADIQKEESPDTHDTNELSPAGEVSTEDTENTEMDEGGGVAEESTGDDLEEEKGETTEEDDNMQIDSPSANEEESKEVTESEQTFT